MNHPIRQDMTKEPVTIMPDLSLQAAQEIMRSWGMRHLQVTKKSKKLIGLLSERDVLRSFALGLKPSAAFTEAIAKSPFALTGNVSIGKVAREMAENKFGGAVVVNRDNEVIVFLLPKAFLLSKSSLATGIQRAKFFRPVVAVKGAAFPPV